METKRTTAANAHKKPSLKASTHNGRSKAHVGEAANHLLNEGKKLANEVYEDGLNKLEDVQDELKVYSDELLKKVQKNPLTSLLIAGGVGFLLSLLLKK
ncbi:TPA: hypothetical protein ACPSKE_002004 [Legionella feeleii]|uniref:Bacterial protein of uncharacterized function (DUF883) n=1 Tax=Legionella feeleii TaxID=453 RepID=A0A0W0TT27_9GAMM|nr:DUF883 C-terminal domain-containing protein [Legionella feeleii]KTC98555.1 hypothetical protein Lfee_1512 [Legionella feeleii]SPX62314.1 Bacterial protein of uncharacterised function (DUF883) [Legionella feeleii]STX37945.1 Bacterial protein of uncharacterised function (DUF883) [Legionella feeleii]